MNRISTHSMIDPFRKFFVDHKPNWSKRTYIVGAISIAAIAGIAYLYFRNGFAFFPNSPAGSAKPFVPLNPPALESAKVTLVHSNETLASAAHVETVLSPINTTALESANVTLVNSNETLANNTISIQTVFAPIHNESNDTSKLFCNITAIPQMQPQSRARLSEFEWKQLISSLNCNYPRSYNRYSGSLFVCCPTARQLEIYEKQTGCQGVFFNNTPHCRCFSDSESVPLYDYCDLLKLSKSKC